VKAALLQTTSSDDPEKNALVISEMIAEAVAGGAEFVLTPEVSNIVSFSRSLQNRVLRKEEDDAFLAAMKAAALQHRIWLSVGSIALRTNDPDGRFANRSFLIDPKGQIVARYDKIHMFDAQVSETEVYRESAGYRAGEQAVVCETPFGTLGLSICYDVRFAHLYRSLAKAGAEVLLVPSAFSPNTGAAHWETLLRARAIETGCYVLASAQTGLHSTSEGRARKTFGHTLAVSPWGELLGELGDDTGILFVDIDAQEVSKARKRLPSLSHDRAYRQPYE